MSDLVLALDVPDKAAALRIARECAPHIDALKIGYPLVLAAGPAFVRTLSELGVPLIADFKVADIPNTSRLICEQVFSYGFNAVICQGFTGSDSILSCVETAHDHRGECYVVAEMSHPGALEFFSGGTAERIARAAKTCKADGIIAPATRPERVRVLKEIVGEMKILSPGVGAQGGDPDAIAGLVDGIIVGRQIYESADPAREARRLAYVRR